jgi:hypothetical protein
VANTLWAYAKMGREPGERVMMLLEGRVGEVVREYNAQDVANTLWAYATMGREPGERVMGMLEGRVGEVVREYNAQDVTNTLWAYATMEREPGERVMGALEARAVLDSSSMGADHLKQLHQYMLTCRLSRCSRGRSTLSELDKLLGARCQEAFAAAAAASAPSQSQREVAYVLRDCMGLRVKDEYCCPESGYSIDMLVEVESPSATSAETFGAVQRWAVEFDGPSHFMACASPTGATLLKHRHLRLLGHNLVVVPYWEWDKVRGDKASQVKYLRSKLGSRRRTEVHDNIPRERVSATRSECDHLDQIEAQFFS